VKEKRARLWTPYELRFRAGKSGRQAYWDTDLWVTFEGPEGRSHRVAGFWAGGRTWKVRFAPPQVGLWSWRSQCNDRAMHGLDGGFECTGSRSGVPGRRHGPLQVSEDGRYLVHADGTPFFWLADTGWCLLQELDVPQARTYARHRAEQGFSVVQVVGIFARRREGSAQEVRRGALMHNSRGHPACTVTDRGLLPHPSFFKHVDALLGELQKAGLLVALLPHWGFLANAYLTLHHVRGFFQPGDVPIFYQADGARYARYIGARYGAFLPVWVLGGDVRAETDQQLAYWRAVADGLDEGSGTRLPRTYHPMGHHSSSQWLHEEPWLDLNMVQSGHSTDNTNAYALVGADFERTPVKPVINGEPCYENISNHLSRRDARPIDDHQVRKAFFWSVLSGAVSGHTYGANNGFQFTPAMTYYGLEVADWLTNVRSYPGGIQLGGIAQFLRGLPWWTLRPAPGLIPAEDNPDGGAHIVAARSLDDQLTLVYVPQPDVYQPALATVTENRNTYWFDPRAAELSPTTSLRAPSGEDWLFITSAEKLPI